MPEEHKIWFVHKVEEKKTYGPFALDELKQLIINGRVGGLDKIARKGESWQTAYSVPEVSALFVKKKREGKTPVPAIQAGAKQPLISVHRRKQLLLVGGILILLIGIIFIFTNKHIQEIFKNLFGKKEVQVVQKEEIPITGTAEEHVARARELIKKGMERFPSAEEEFRVALKLNSAYEPALLGLQELYLEWGRKTGDKSKIEESIKVSENVLRVNPESADAYTLRAFAYNEMGKTEESKLSAENAFRLRQDDWRITYLLAEIYLLDASTRARAIDFFEKTVKINPEQSESHRRLAVLYEEDKRYSDAVSHLEKLSILVPEDSTVFFSLGLNYSRIDKLRDSVKAYKRCIELAPGYVEARINLSRLLFERLEDFEEAEKSIEQLLSGYYSQLSDFDKKYFSVALGRIYMLKERYDDAKRIFEDVIKSGPNHIDAHFYLGDAYFALNKYHEAEKEYREVLRLNPDSAAVHLALAKVMEKIERRDLAVDELKTVLRLDPTFGEANFLLGKYQEQAGYYYEAMDYYKKAIENNPDYIEAHYALAQNAFKVGENKLAIEEFKRVKSLDSKYGDVTYYLGEAYFAEGNIKLAVKEYKEYVRDNPQGKFKSQAETKLRHYR